MLGSQTFAYVAIDVLNHHHRIINHQPDGDGQTAQRHQIQCSAEDFDEKECGDHGERQTYGGDDSNPCLPEENKQNHDCQEAANQDGIANAAH